MRSFLIALFGTAVIAAALIVPAGHTPQQDDWQQTWKLYRSMEAGSVHFGIERVRPNHHNSSSHDVPLSRFQGLTAESLARGGNAHFEYVHDAGKLVCEGHTS